jgi:dihydrolipoamide dehydrogenase
VRRSLDVAILGAGTAGLAAYDAAAAVTPNVVVIEHGPFGTTCARVGCMPSKLLIAAADVAHEARRAERFGVETAVRVDGRAVMARVRRERDRFVDLVVKRTAQIPADRVVSGHARITGPNTLDVDGAVLDARAIVVAVGTVPAVPEMFSTLGDRVATSDDVFSWTTLPESVAVFGAGPIGLELGQALHRLGVRVRIFGRGGGVGPLTDPIVKEAALGALRDELELDPDAHVRAVRRVDDGVAVDFDAESSTFALALVATGRRPSFAGLGLESAGIELDARGAPPFDRATMRCGGSSIFVAGDASGDLPVLHEATDGGKRAGENAARHPNASPHPRRSRLQIVFCDPQIATVGSTFEELSKRDDFVVGTIRFEDQGRSRVMGRNRGTARLYSDRATGRFLGAEMCAPSGEHLAHLLAWAHQMKLTVADILALPIYHPVVEEGLRTALLDAELARTA